jgi:hypothetical protein
MGLNPLSWFSTKQEKAMKSSIAGEIVWEGRQVAIKALKNPRLAEGRLFFKVQASVSLGEVLHIEPMASDELVQHGATCIREVLLTPRQAVLVRLISRSAGGDGKNKTAHDLSGAGAPHAEMTAEQLFGAEVLDKARPEKIRPATPQGK